jgi:hypothetical protein
MLVFVHLPKTAGTTLHKIITHQYPKSRIRIHHDSDGPPSAELASRIKARDASIVMGHFSVGLHAFIPDLRYITCLRDPAQRVISHYNHALNDPGHYLHREATSISLAKYVSSGLSGELSDGMTRMLAGISDFHHGTVTEDTLAIALANIESRFDAVIPSERFDEGILLLAQDLGWKTPYYLRRKVGRYPRLATSPDPETIRIIEEYNRFDRQLYDFCSEKFEKRANHLPDLPQRLTRFRTANATFGKAVFFAREIKARASNS